MPAPLRSQQCAGNGRSKIDLPLPSRLWRILAKHQVEAIDLDQVPCNSRCPPGNLGRREQVSPRATSRISEPIDLDCKSAESDRPADANLGAVHGRDAPHNRQTQSAAALAATDDPEETLAHTLQILLGQTWSAVLDLESDMCLSFRYCDSYERIGRAVSDRVVDKVAHQHRQQHFIALHPIWFDRVDF